MTSEFSSRNQTSEHRYSKETRIENGRILVVDDERSARTALAQLLHEEGYVVQHARDGYKALGYLKSDRYDIVLTDLRMPLMDGIELIEKGKQASPQTAFIVMTAYGSIEDAVHAMKMGAQEFLIKPINFEAVEMIVRRTRNMQRLESELFNLKAQHAANITRSRFISSSSTMKDVLKLANHVADSPVTILICGESGTGKQCLARYIHESSSRKHAPFKVIHCASLPENFLELELFGVDSSNPDETKTSLIDQAAGGTLFLDEVTALPPMIQAKLLDFINHNDQDVRIIASTKESLETFVRKGTFREDLYFRINVVRLNIPPLSARKSDIPALVQHFVSRYARQNHREIEQITPEFMEKLEQHDWPGNVQELENVVERAIVLSDSKILSHKVLPKELGEFSTNSRVLGRGVMIPGSKLADIERFVILQTYEATGGKTSETAEILDVSQRKVQYKLREIIASQEHAAASKK